ncbi:MAG TPA: OsmC family protein [Hanamia sp.]|nr:OsmC family protein [Hanamia sp.]
MTASIIYTGNLRCEAEHIQSKSQIETDAPTDNHGKGERFSPTDMLCVSLATCMLTTMGIKAADMKVDITNAKAAVTKHMASDPRRVAKIEVEVSLPANGDEKERLILEKTGNNCPVAKSVHPDIELVLNYKWSGLPNPSRGGA